MNALVASEAKRNVASRGFLLTWACHCSARAGTENAGSEQLRDFMARRAPKLTGIAVGRFGKVFERCHGRLS
ncbi:MAG: hypothetical protein ACK4FE_12570 [Azonexus sp.]|jgi:hypothetical protein